MKDSIILSMKDISKYYPGVAALDRVSIDIREGEVHALLGENGAGKSTFIKIAAGAIAPDHGTITMNGTVFKKLNPAEARKQGIEVIYQEFNLLPDMSIAENIYMGARVSDKRLVDYAAMREGAKELFQEFNIKINPDALVCDLTPAFQQIVEIAKAVSKNVKVLIMDEPTAPLTVSEVELMYKIIDRLKKRGVTIIYISHRLEEVFRITDRITILRDGKYVASMMTKDTNRVDLIRDRKSVV